MSNTKKTAMAVKIQFSSDKYKLSELNFWLVIPLIPLRDYPFMCLIASNNSEPDRKRHYFPPDLPFDHETVTEHKNRLPKKRKPIFYSLET